MTLGEKQRFLCGSLTCIEAAAYALGYSLVREDAKRAESVHGKFGVKGSYASAHSVHKKKLAQDYSIFKDGEYLEGDAADLIFSVLHDVADVLCLAKRIEGDLGHFSMEFEGYR